MSLLVATFLSLFAVAEPAPTPPLVRVALLVGHNRGSSARPALRYAEADARRMADVLVELGDVRPEHNIVLLGASRTTLDGAFAGVTRTVARLREGGARVSLLFFFSGHSDGRALELGDERVFFSDVREAMARTGADVRLAIVDSCKSGGLLGIKGGTLGPAFDIQLANELDTVGEAVITSSAADEVALESVELRASFFSHHLLSGLRGAADKSGDGIVTLAEAYEHAFTRTVRATSGTSIGTQHPVYDYRLSGQGEIALTRLDRPSAALEITPRFSRTLIVHAGRDEVLGELGPQTARRLAVVPGPFAVYGQRDGKLFVARVQVARGERRVLVDEDFTPAPAGTRIYAKGDAADLESRPAASAERASHVFVGGGVATPVARSLDYAPGVWLGWLGRGSLPLGLELGWTTGAGGPPEFRESQATVRLGVRPQVSFGPVSLSLGAEVGGGLVWQTIERGDTRWSAMATWGAGAGVSCDISRSWLVGAWFSAGQTLARQDGSSLISFTPRGYLAMGWRL